MTNKVNKKIFSTPHDGIVVSHDTNGVLYWNGHYDGAPIKQAIPAPDGSVCVILIDPDSSKRSVFENLLCIDRAGKVVWAARLTGNPDVFLDIKLCPEGILTHTWSGVRLLLNKETGMELERQFVK